MVLCHAHKRKAKKSLKIGSRRLNQGPSNREVGILEILSSNQVRLIDPLAFDLR